jgi:hypothetical protein
MGAFFMPGNQKGGASMLFTEGKDQVFERMMQERPSFGRRLDKTPKERDCPHCLYYDNKMKKCSLDRCIVFRD